MRQIQLRWTTEDTDPNEVVVHLAGEIDEDSTLADLLAELDGYGSIRLDLKDITRINSVGVREWVNFIRGLERCEKLVLARCSPVMVAQLNMIANFSGTAQIQSVCAPYVCDDCGYEETVLVDTSREVRIEEVSARTCPECQSEMELDDLPETYFAFLAT